MSACPTLTTDRLVLRPFRADDLEPFFAMMTTPEVRASLHVPESFSLDDAWGTLLRFAGLWEIKGLGQWAIEERDSGRLVGRAGLYWRPDEDWPGVELGWMLDPSVWGSGYATEAAHRAARYGFEELDEVTLYSVILPENTRSQAAEPMPMTQVRPPGVSRAPTERTSPDSRGQKPRNAASAPGLSVRVRKIAAVVIGATTGCGVDCSGPAAMDQSASQQKTDNGVTP